MKPDRTIPAQRPLFARAGFGSTGGSLADLPRPSSHFVCGHRHGHDRVHETSLDRGVWAGGEAGGVPVLIPPTLSHARNTASDFWGFCSDEIVRNMACPPVPIWGSGKFAFHQGRSNPDSRIDDGRWPRRRLRVMLNFDRLRRLGLPYAVNATLVPTVSMT